MPSILKISATPTPPSFWMRLAAKTPFAHIVYTVFFLAYITPAVVDGSLWLHLSAPNTSEMISVSRRQGYVERSVLENLRPSPETSRRYARLMGQ